MPNSRINRNGQHKSSYRSRTRNQKGSIIEFAVSLPLIIVAVSIALNLGVTLLGVRAVDLAARDAARAASLQQTKEAAMMAAKTALQAHSIAGQTPKLDETAFVFDTAKVPKGVVYAGPGPVVVVKVDAALNLPFKTLLTTGVSDKDLDVSRSYTFPIMKLPNPGPVVAGSEVPSV